MTTSTFSRRLREALAMRGVYGEDAKVERLAGATGRNARSVRRWLAGDARPSGHGLFHIANDLGVEPGWLYDGRGINPFHAWIDERLSGAPQHMIDGLMRYWLRLMNNDPKALRWAAMRERGELSMEQMLSMA